MTLAAYLVGVVSVVFESVSVAAVLLLGASIPAFELNTWRFGIQTTMCVPCLWCNTPAWSIHVPRVKWLQLTAIIVNSGIYNL